MHTIRRALLLSAFLLLSVLATAAPFTASFDALRADLQTRQMNDYGGTLTKSQKKELKAIQASLARIADPHANLFDDAKSAAFIIKKLVPAFPAEFDESSPGTLPGFVAGMVQGLIGEAEKLYGPLEVSAASIPDPTARAAAQAKLAAARAAIDAAAADGATPATSAKQLAKAAKAVREGLAIVARETGPRLTARIGARKFAANEFEAQYAPDQFLFISGTLSGGGGPDERISIAIREAPFVGSHTLTGFSPFAGNYGIYQRGDGDGSQWLTGEGTVEITVFDTAAGRVAGTFEMTTHNVPQKKVIVRQGSFDITGLTGP